VDQVAVAREAAQARARAEAEAGGEAVEDPGRFLVPIPALILSLQFSSQKVDTLQTSM
jgi:hypothetical protein